MTLHRKRDWDADLEEEPGLPPRRRSRPWDPAEDAPPRPPRRADGHPVLSFFLFLLGLGAALLAFGVLVARTAGFREIVSVKNAQWTGTRVAIGGSRIAWPYDLVLTEVTLTNAAGRDKPGLYIPLVRAQWRPGRGAEVRMEGPEVRLQQAGDSIVPEELALLGRVKTEADVAEWLKPVRDRAVLRVEGGLLAVMDGEGKEVRRMEGIRLEAVPAAVPGLPAWYYRLKAAGVDAAWLYADETGVLELARPKGEPPRGRDLWKGIQP